MNADSLQALIIDEHCGELPPEVADLLAAHLARDPEARAEAERLRQALGLTRQAVQQHPELVRGLVMEPPARRWRTRWPESWLARAALLALLGSLTAAAGFLAGRMPVTLAKTVPTADAPASPRQPGPWARYRMSFDPAGQGVQVVRVDTNPLRQSSRP